MPPAKKEAGLDLAKLQELSEPFTLRVERMRGNGWTPLSPEKRGDAMTDPEAPSGAGWSRDDIVQTLDKYLLEWAGGGIFRITAIDANQQSLMWKANLGPEQMFPPKLTPSEKAAADPLVVAQHEQKAAAAAVQAAQVSAQAHAQAAQAQAIQAQHAPPPAPRPQHGVAPMTYPPPPAAPAAPYATPVPATPVATPGYVAPAPGYGWPSAPAPMATPLPAARPVASGPGVGPGSNWQTFFGRNEESSMEIEKTKRLEEENKRLQEEQRRQEVERLKAESAAAIERERQRAQAEIEKTQAEMRRLAESRSANDIDSKLEKIQAQTAAQIAALAEGIKAMAEKITARPPEDNAHVKMLEEKIRQSEERAERERERHERERKEDALRQEMKEQAARTEALMREQREAMEKVMREQREQSERVAREAREAALAAAANKGPDQMYLFMQEMARQQAENLREMARTSQANMQAMSGMMMTPDKLAGLIRDQSSVTDGLLGKMAGAYGGVFDTMKNAFESITQLGAPPADNPVPRIIEGAIVKGAETVDRIMAARQAQIDAERDIQVARTNAQGQIEIAKVHATAAAYAAAHPEQVAAPPAPAPLPAPAPAPAATPPGGGLNGAAIPAPVSVVSANGTTNGHGYNPPAQTEIHPMYLTPPPREVAPAPDMPTDKEIFGIVLPQIEQLRGAVKAFHENLRNEKGEIIGSSPEGTVKLILLAIDRINEAKVNVPAIGLIERGEFAAFIDVLIPNASPKYRAECVRILTEDVEWGEEDQDGDTDEDHEAAPPPPPKKPKNGKGRAARA